MAMFIRRCLPLYLSSLTALYCEGYLPRTPTTGMICLPKFWVGYSSLAVEHVQVIADAAELGVGLVN